MLRSYKDLVITDLLILLYIRTSGIYISPFMVMYRTMDGVSKNFEANR